jgi:hypothetical protein
VEVVGLTVAVALAVGGWIVNGWLARRGARRGLRVEYLLSAYRTLDAVSNRETITADQARELEGAIADVFLLGNERQVELARQFSDEFAQSGGGNTTALLEDLRIDLRRELLLGDAGERTTWLRVEPGTTWTAASARVIAGLAEAARRPVPSPRGQVHHREERPSSDSLRDIEEAYEGLASLVVDLVPDVSDAADPILEAARSGDLSAQSSNTLEGLSIMYQLAVGDRRGVSQDQRDEFLTLTNAAGYALRNEIERS